MSRSWIHLCFFVSGFSGLVNEVVWSRLFSYTMGSSHHSIAVVVSTFMGGLALGSWIGGPLADRARSALRLYGWLIALTGLLCGAVVPILSWSGPLLGRIYRWHDGEPVHPLFTVAKALLCSATILLPTTLMGATLPALTRHLTRDPLEVGARLGFLYAVNTFGAVAGTAAAGFYLIGAVGLGWSAAIAAGLDLLVGGAVLFATRAGRGASGADSPGGVSASPPLPAPAEGVSATGSGSPWPMRVAVAAFGISGFANMCLQLGWTRALIISIGNSTYAFSLIVGIFIFGLAAGGWIAGLFADRLRDPIAAFGWLLLAIACAAGATIPWLGLSPARFAWDLGALSRRPDFSFYQFLALGAWRISLVILPATLLMGMTFPLVGRIRARLAPGIARSAPGIGQAVGSAYAANTLGAILGTALTGFVLLPLVGRTWALLYLAAGLGFGAGIAVLIFAPGTRRGRRFALAGSLAALVLILAYATRPAGVLDSALARPGEERAYWHPVVMGQGAYRKYDLARQFPSADAYLSTQLKRWESLYSRDGEAGSVAVLRRRADGHLCLNIAGKTDASAGRRSHDLQTQRLLGHLPLLIHPSPRRALTLGLGCGMTLGAMTLYPELESIDLLEISPEVVEAARLHFAAANHGALGDPRVRTIIGDGRNHLQHTGRTYDLISSEPSNFWIAGLGNLFTEEFYRAVRERLEPGGLVCQWIYCYSIRVEDYRTALRTFLRVFPRATIWTNNDTDTILVGAKDALAIDRGAIARRLESAAARADLAEIGVERPEDLLRYFVADAAAYAEWIGPGPLNRDLHPVLEFSSPLGFFDTFPGIQAALDRLAPERPPAELLRGFSAEGTALLEARYRQGRALTRFYHDLFRNDRAGVIARYQELSDLGDVWGIESASWELTSRFPAGGKSAEKGGGGEIVDVIDRARRIHDTPDLCLADSFRVVAGADFSEQIEIHRRAARAAPIQRWQTYVALARLETEASNLPQALESIDAAERLAAPVPTSAYLRGVVLGMQGDLAGAEREFRKALEAASGEPSNPARGAKGRAAKEIAEMGFEKGEAAYNLGYCLEQGGRLEEAERAYLQAIDLENDAVRARVAIARCLRTRGKLPEALESARRALQSAKESNRESGEARAEIARTLAAGGDLPQAIEWMESAVKASGDAYRAELDALRSRAGQ